MLDVSSLEDTEAGIAAAVNAGRMAIAIPNAITAGQDLSRAYAVISHTMDLNEWDPSALPEKFPE